PRLPLDLDRSNLPGSEPKIVAGSHLKPLSGAAGINSPHHVPSAGRKFLTGPQVRNTVVAPLTLTLTPVGLTLIVCAITAGARKNRKMADRKILDRKMRLVRSVCRLRKRPGDRSANWTAKVSTHVFCAGGAADISRWWSAA